jgi:hypothetical protein
MNNIRVSLTTSNEPDIEKYASALVELFQVKVTNSRGTEVQRRQLPGGVINDIMITIKNSVKFLMDLVLFLPNTQIPSWLEKIIVNALVMICPLVHSKPGFDVMWDSNDSVYRSYEDWQDNQIKYELANKEALVAALADQQNSIWLILFIIPLKIEFGSSTTSSESIDRELAAAILEKLKSINAYDDLARLLAYSKKFDICDYEELLLLLSKDTNHHLALNTLLIDNERRINYLKLMESKCQDLLQASVKPSRGSTYQLLNSYAKSVRKLLASWNQLNLINEYPSIAIAKSIGQCQFILRNLKDVLTSPGNPNYDTQEICCSVADNIVHMYEKFEIESSRELFLTILRDLLKISSLQNWNKYFILQFNQIDAPKLNTPVSVGELEHDNGDFFTPKSPIHFLTTDVSSIEERIKEKLVVGLDAEWAVSDLSIVQLSIDFKTGRETFILDTLALDRKILSSLFTVIFKQCIIVGFDLSGDLKRITKHCKLELSPSTIVDIQAKRLEGCKSLNDYSFSLLGKKLDKRPRMGLWEKRPLCRSMLLYAGADAEVLLEIHQKLSQARA